MERRLTPTVIICEDMQRRTNHWLLMKEISKTSYPDSQLASNEIRVRAVLASNLSSVGGHGLILRVGFKTVHTARPR